MSNNNLKLEEFKVVTYKKGKAKFPKKATNKFLHLHSSTASENFNLETAIRRIETAKNELVSSDLYASVLASLREGLQILNSVEIREIVCFGLGNVDDCMISRYQFALLLLLKELYKAKVILYDPIFNDDDHAILKNFELNVLSYNNEGKYQLVHSSTTIFFLPHCPKQLSNNLLWANWGLSLSYCIVIANSFTKIIETHSKRHILENAPYILNISPFVTELPIINTFKYFDIFNDLAIHIFPLENLSFISEDFWQYRIEPKYSEEEVEFISNSDMTVLDFNN
ncbi:hypothetical protein FQA39_LY12758 [Lamprigera yunnana]|nr:hypothetical protein FQA39_LY12758 [Lamprigera yunnana]